MANIEIKKIVDKIQKDIKGKRANSKATKKDLTILINCMLKSDYSDMFNTKLYNKYSAEYCEILEILYQVTKEIK